MKTILKPSGEDSFWKDAVRDLVVVVVNRGGALSNRSVSGLADALTDVTELEPIVGGGSAVVDGADLVVTIGAGESAVFVP